MGKMYTNFVNTVVYSLNEITSQTADFNKT